jgi:hypothetical protein
MPTPDMTIINIHGILANSVKVKGSGNVIRRDGWKKVYTLNINVVYAIDTGHGGASEAIIRDSGGNFLCSKL